MYNNWSVTQRNNKRKLNFTLLYNINYCVTERKKIYTPLVHVLYNKQCILHVVIHILFI